MPAFRALQRNTDRDTGRTGNRASPAVNAPFDAVNGGVAEAPHVVIVTVYGAGGGEHQAVTRETGDLDNHHLLPEAAIHLDVK